MYVFLMLNRSIVRGLQARQGLKQQDLLGEPHFRLVRADEPPALLVGSDADALILFAFMQLKRAFEEKGLPVPYIGFDPNTPLFGGLPVDRFMVLRQGSSLGDALKTEGGFSQVGIILRPQSTEAEPLFLEVLGRALPTGLPPIETL